MRPPDRPLAVRVLMGLVFAASLAGGLVFAARAALAQEKGQAMPIETETADFAGGCFWCLESAFAEQPGLVSTVVGYSGGTVESPTYEQVSTGKTGHAETVEVVYDPQKTDYRALVSFFLTSAHDPTQIDRQGVDIGPQYRSVIFYRSEAQKAIAEAEIARLTAARHFKAPIATRVAPFMQFWVAEDYHQKYYDKYEALTGRPHVRALQHKK